MEILVASPDFVMIVYFALVYSLAFFFPLSDVQLKTSANNEYCVLCTVTVLV